MPKKNILLLNSTLHIGGAESVIAALCRNLDRDRFNVTVGLLKEQGVVADKLLVQGFDVALIRPSGSSKVNYLSFLNLRRFIQERKIDLVHTHDLHSLLDASLCRLSLSGFKLMHTFHFGNYPHRRKRYLFLESIFRRVPDKLVAVGKVQRRTLIQTFGIPEARIETVWNGVGADKRAVAATFQQYAVPGITVIGSISTLIEQKGLTYLLDAVAELKKLNSQFVLLIAGEGVLRSELEKKAERLGLSGHVHFLGWVNDAASTLIPVIDVFVQTSLWEGMSMVVLEAMAQGKPVVATTVGDNPYVVEHGKTGYLVKPADAPALAAALNRLLDDPALRNRFGLAGREEWKAKHGADAMTRNYQRLYEELL